MAQADPLNRLQDLLRQESEHLRAGRLDALGDLASDKETLLNSLAGLSAASEGQVAAIRTMARHNGDLMQAAMAGLKNAQARLAQMRGKGAPLQTYGQDGKRLTLGARTASLNLRA